MFKRGTQVINVPTHARDEKGCIIENHPAVEYGFIMEYLRGRSAARVRYFRAGSDELRTKSGSELTPVANLFEYRHRPQKVINDILRKINNNGHDAPMNV